MTESPSELRTAISSTSAIAASEKPSGEPEMRLDPDPRLVGASGDARDVRLYRRMRFIRRFEETLLSLFEEGVLNGTTHACVGQEADCVAVIEHLRPGDHIFSNHRCHGHYLAWTGDAVGLLAEVMGKSHGVVGGIGGSQHLCAPGFKSNGILGGTLPAAAGIALAMKLAGDDAISTVFMGDGAWGEGVVYETMNMAALWELPLLVVVENNGYSQSTPIRLNMAGDIQGRFAAFGIETAHIDSTDVLEIDAVAARQVDGGPHDAAAARPDHRHVSALPPQQERRQSTRGRDRGALDRRAAGRPRPPPA